ncbi:MAG: hypothetical protein ACR2K6_05580 [Solirubrobacterales bacterium]
MYTDKPTFTELETFFRGFCRDGGMREPDRMETIPEKEAAIFFWDPEDFKVGFELGAMKKEPNGEVWWRDVPPGLPGDRSQPPTGPPVEPPPLEEVRRSLVELCERSEMREPDRIEEPDDGDLIAFWDEEKLAIVVEMDPVPGDS